MESIRYCPIYSPSSDHKPYLHPNPFSSRLLGSSLSCPWLTISFPVPLTMEMCAPHWLFFFSWWTRSGLSKPSRDFTTSVQPSCFFRRPCPHMYPHPHCQVQQRLPLCLVCRSMTQSPSAAITATGHRVHPPPSPTQFPDPVGQFILHPS